MMKMLFAILLGLAVAAPASGATPLHVIFDTDMGNDVDDALALAMLHAFANRGEVKLLAVTVSKDNPWAAEYVRLVDEYYGRGSIPVGIVHDGKTKDDGLYVRQVCELHGRHPDKSAVQDAVELLRKTLAGESDGAVTMMAGNFAETKPEYNVMTDIPAATRLFATWPTDIYISGYEVGAAILYPE